MDTILEALKQSRRWGVNNQPSLDVIANFLSSLPLLKVEMKAEDQLYFSVARPLTPSEAYTLASLGQDTPERIEDNQTSFVLWWD